MKKVPDEKINKSAILERISQLEREIPQDQARIEFDMTRVAMKRGALLELRQLLTVKVSDNVQKK